MSETLSKPKISKQWMKIITSLPGYNPFDQQGECWFDERWAEGFVDFIERYCSHIEGALAGKPFIMETWQRAIVGNLFGWRKIDAYGREVRRYREGFVYVARKNGKTPLGAALMNACFFLDDEAGQQNFCAAGETEQASLSFRHIAGMIANQPKMSKSVREYTGRRRIVRESDGSYIRVLSSDADNKHGGNPHFVIVDEVHVQKNRDLIDVFQTAMASLNRIQPITLYLTTADYMRESICNEKYEYACKVRDGVIDDPAFLPVIFEASPDDDWTTEEAWRKANPNLGVSVSIDFMRRECLRAQETPAYENTFKRLHLNIRTEQDVRWMPLEVWDACNEEVIEDQLRGKSCFAGFDLSTTQDIAGYVLLFLPEDEEGVYRVLPRFYAPRDHAEKREVRDRAPYLTWSRQGFMKLTDGNVTDYAAIKADFERDAERFDIQEAAFDRWQFEALRQQFMADGMRDDMFVSFGQGYASMTAPMKEIDKILASKRLAHGGHPVLRWMASNMAVEMDPAGNLKPSKSKSTEKIDGIVMTVMALGRAMVKEPKRVSVYETRGLRTTGDEPVE
jgi:phage terminase large subunit-like protein